MVDATRRRQTENALRTSEERLRLAKHAADLGIFDWDSASGALYLDERSRELWGLGPEEAATYAKLLAGIYPADRVVTQAALDRALDPTGNGEYQADFRVIRPIDGIERAVRERPGILHSRACSTACGHPTGHHRA